MACQLPKQQLQGFPQRNENQNLSQVRHGSSYNHRSLTSSAGNDLWKSGVLTISEATTSDRMFSYQTQDGPR